MTDERNPVELLADEFVTRQRRGESVTVDEYARAHPHLAAEIRALFPTVAALEGLKRDASSAAERAAPGPAPPPRLGDLRLIDEIGRGGMGVVYEAVQESLDRTVAVKVLPRGRLGTRGERFRREAQTASRLHHTNIVPIFGTGSHDGYEYYVMQRIRGVGLDQVMAVVRGDVDATDGHEPRDRLAREVARSLLTPEPAEFGREGSPRGQTQRSYRGNPIYYRNVARLGVQVADALEHAHLQGTLHRDIKPSNLLLDTHRTIWVTDFGLAKALEHEDLTRSGDIVGTLRYMAPEQTRGACETRSDIYALGLTLYEMVALQPAFAGYGKSQLLQKILSGGLPPLRSIDDAAPIDLATIIAKACATEPTDRYAAAAELGADLQRFLDGRPIKARPVSAVWTVWRWCQRNRATAALAACAVGAALTAGISGWIGYGITSRALDGERAAKDRAAGNLELSLQAFADVFDQLSGPDLALPHLEDPETGELTALGPVSVAPEDAELLGHISQFYERFAERNAEDVSLRWEAAKARRRVGDIERRLGRYPEARSAYERAIELYRGLAPDGADTIGDRAVDIALAYNGLGKTLRDERERQAAETAHEHALDILQNVESPRSTTVALETARTLNSLGACEWSPRAHYGRRGGRWRRGEARTPAEADQRRMAGHQSLRDAAKHHRAALAIVTDLQDNSTERHPQMRFVEARSRRFLSWVTAREHAEAAAEHDRTAVALLEGLAAEFPDVDAYRFELAETLRHPRRQPRGERSRETDEARRQRVARALELFRDLEEKHPNIPSYRAGRLRAQFESTTQTSEAPRAQALTAMRDVLHEQLEWAGTPTGHQQVRQSVWMLRRFVGRLQRTGRHDLLAAETTLLAAELPTDVRGEIARLLSSFHQSHARELEKGGDEAGALAARERAEALDPTHRSRGRD
ncbi:MAG: serine/threonine-protein kinase [Planctomycetota bacterium]